MTPATVVLLALIAAWAVWAVRRLTKRGMCDCHGGGKESGGCHGCSGCASGDGQPPSCPACSLADSLEEGMKKAQALPSQPKGVAVPSHGGR